MSSLDPFQVMPTNEVEPVLRTAQPHKVQTVERELYAFMSKIKGYASLMDGIDKIMGKLKQTRDERDIKEFFVCGLYNKVME